MQQIAPVLPVGKDFTPEWRKVMSDFLTGIGRSDRAEEVLAEYDAHVAQVRPTVEPLMAGKKVAFVAAAEDQIAWFQNDFRTAVAEDLGFEVLREGPDLRVMLGSEQFNRLEEADVIFALDRSASGSVYTSPTWQRLPAAQAGRVIPFDYYKAAGYALTAKFSSTTCGRGQAVEPDLRQPDGPRSFGTGGSSCHAVPKLAERLETTGERPRQFLGAFDPDDVLQLGNVVGLVIALGNEKRRVTLRVDDQEPSRRAEVVDERALGRRQRRVEDSTTEWIALLERVEMKVGEGPVDRQCPVVTVDDLASVRALDHAQPVLIEESGDRRPINIELHVLRHPHEVQRETHRSPSSIRDARDALASTSTAEKRQNYLSSRVRIASTTSAGASSAMK